LPGPHTLPPILSVAVLVVPVVLVVPILVVLIVAVLVVLIVVVLVVLIVAVLVVLVVVVLVVLIVVLTGHIHLRSLGGAQVARASVMVNNHPRRAVPALFPGLG
jgi:hypothetical protein